MLEGASEGWGLGEMGGAVFRNLAHISYCWGSRDDGGFFLAFSVAGYKTRGCSQPEAVHFTLKILVSAAPVALIILGLLLFKLYPIDEEKRRKNKKALQELR